MPLFWFLAGMLTTLASLIVILPWLRTIPRFHSLPALPWQASVGGVVIVIAVLGLYRWLGRSGIVAQPGPLTPPIARAMESSTTVDADAPTPTKGSPAASMSTAIASLQARLAKGGGSSDDWELLAKSYEFIGRPTDAAKARSRQLPVPPDADAPAALSAVSGEVSLAAALRTKAQAGATVFIVAKSVDSPGAPVAVYRTSVGAWPLKFTLDDSQSMVPGRNLSNAGRVTIEARISRSGQPLPASGDLKGASGVINPADHQPLKIVIDQVIS